MINIKGELWNGIGKVDAICITTNGFVKKNGEAVMGRGCALEATKRYPDIQIILGTALRHNGNHAVRLMNDKGTDIWSFPVKHNWWEEADIELIRRSALEMMDAANTHPQWKTILIPRPGCGNGKLSYKDVEPILAEILDDRFFVVTH
jgi:hypothetical protein